MNRMLKDALVDSVVDAVPPETTADGEEAADWDNGNTQDDIGKAAELCKLYGRYNQAELLYRRALEGMEKALGPEHPDTLTALINLAAYLYNQGEYTEALVWYEMSLVHSRKAFDDDDERTKAREKDVGDCKEHMWIQGHSSAMPTLQSAADVPTAKP